jgi:LPS export ABC transporter protein LptC
VLGLLIAGLVLGLFYLVFVHELPRSEEHPVASPVLNLTMEGVVVRQQRGNAVEWVVEADKAVYFEGIRQAVLQPVTFRVFQGGGDNPGALNITGTAGRAFMDQARDLVLLDDGARILRGDRLEIRSRSLEYLHTLGEVRARGEVWVHEDNATLVGASLIYSIAKDQVFVTAPRFSQ